EPRSAAAPGECARRVRIRVPAPRGERLACGASATTPKASSNLRAAGTRLANSRQREATMLISIKDPAGFHLAATDGSIGEVQDCYFDDVHWTVRYLVVDTGGWLSGRKVLISPMAVREIDAAGRRVIVALTREQV